MAIAAASGSSTFTEPLCAGASMYIRSRDEQVVVERDDGQDRAEEDQPVAAPARRAAQKTYSFAQKPATNGMPPSDSRKSSIASASSGERCARPAIGVDAVRLLRPRHRLHDQERAHVAEEVGDQIEEHHRDAVRRHRREADQHVADVRDAGVGEQPLDVLLRDRHQVAGDDRDAGQRRRRRGTQSAAPRCPRPRGRAG